MREQVVQGDIFFCPVPTHSLPSKHSRDLKAAATNVIAYGEQTGHAHVLEGNGMLFLNSAGFPFLLRAFDDDVVVKHDTHGVARLKQGDYEIVRQRRLNYKAEFDELVKD
jgi:hypothetical protein